MLPKEIILRIDNISKSFYEVKALQNISFDIYKGEILGLLGANGAGKSTLLKIIGGVQTSDNGHIYLDNENLGSINPHIAHEKGIISVYQELNLFLNMTIAENLFIGRENKSKTNLIDWKATRKKAKTILESLGLDIDPDAEVASLSVANQHLVEIARALSEKPKILLLDEPTASLSDKEIQWLFTKIRELRQNGTTVVYVSHRLDEVTALCERCVILRDGKLADQLDGQFDKEKIIRSMIGHNVELIRTEAKKAAADVILEIKNLRLRNLVKDVSFQLKKGEILGIAGLVGAGRTELLGAIFGTDPKNSGHISKQGKEIIINNPIDAMNNGIMLIPEDRKIDGLFLNESSRFNIASATLDKRARGGFINEKQEKEIVTKASKDVQLDTSRVEHLVKLLSGGNQQKAVIAKSLLVNADVLLLDEPTCGVDIGAREEIYSIIKEVSNQGKSIILVSSDWEELIYLSDRMLVMSEGKITGVLTVEEFTKENIGHLATISDVQKDEKGSKVNYEGMAEGIHPRHPEINSPVMLNAKEYFGKLRTLFNNNNTAILVVVTLVMIIASISISDSFRTLMNARNLLGQAMPFLILTLGQLVVIVAGGLDLSSGALVAATGVLGVSFMVSNPDKILLGVVIMLVFGLIVGLLNSVLVVKAKLDSFVVTLGMSIVLTGVTLVITKAPIGPSPKILRVLANQDIYGIPYVLFLIILLTVVFGILMRYTSLGRSFYAVGENPKGSYWAGLPVQKTQFISFIISSLMAVVASLFLMGRTGAGDPAFGPGMELTAIACALIGGARLGGGRGSMGGALLGVFLLSILENILSLMNVDLWYQEVFSGMLLLAIIITYEYRMKKNKVAFRANT
jgi:ABC-type sugar transport system ATPase subunit/ribose/xylose/arabinose/galactoside ABC-type transport system permease subunit